MYNEGLVMELKDDLATVKIVREGACGHDCATCGGCGGSETMIIAKNEINASVGQFVALEGDGIIVRRAFIVYMLPIIVFFIGYALGHYIFSFNEGLCALLGILFAAIDVAITVKYSRRQKEAGKIPVITKVLDF